MRAERSRDSYVPSCWARDQCCPAGLVLQRLPGGPPRARAVCSRLPVHRSLPGSANLHCPCREHPKLGLACCSDYCPRPACEVCRMAGTYHFCFIHRLLPCRTTLRSRQVTSTERPVMLGCIRGCQKYLHALCWSRNATECLIQLCHIGHRSMPIPGEPMG